MRNQCAAIMLCFETDRLCFKRMDECDREEFTKLLRSLDVTQYCFDTPSLREIKIQFESRLQPWDVESTHWLSLSIYEKSSGSFVGVIGLKKTNMSGDVGFLLKPEYHGLGYGTESLKAVREFSKSLGITELSARITKGNIASVGVVKKCGFVLVAEHKNTIFINQKKYNDLKFRCILL